MSMKMFCSARLIATTAFSIPILIAIADAQSSEPGPESSGADIFVPTKKGANDHVSPVQGSTPGPLERPLPSQIPTPAPSPTASVAEMFSIPSHKLLPDGREIIPNSYTATPLRWVGMLVGSDKDGNRITGSAALVGTRTILTAGHCLKPMEGSPVTFYMGLAGPIDKHPQSAQAKVERYFIWDYFDNHFSMERQGELDLVSWDLGIARLDRNLTLPGSGGIQNVEHGFSAAELTEQSLIALSKENFLHLSGYDGDLQPRPPSGGERSFCLIDRLPKRAEFGDFAWRFQFPKLGLYDDPGAIFYCDGIGQGGASGAPIWFHNKNIGGRACVAGVYSGMRKALSGSRLQGKLLTKKFLDKIEEFNTTQTPGNAWLTK